MESVKADRSSNRKQDRCNRVNLKIEDYSTPLEHTYKFAYYVCILPFLARRTRNGAYVVTTCRAQKILWILMMVQLGHYFAAKMYMTATDAWRKRNASPGNPVLHIHLFGVIAGVLFTFSTLHLNTSRVNSQIAFLNRLVKFTRKFNAMRKSSERISNQKYLKALTLFGISIFYAAMVIVPRAISISTSPYDLMRAFWNTYIVWYNNEPEGFSRNDTSHLTHLFIHISLEIYIWCFSTYFMCVKFLNAAWLFVFVTISCDFRRLVSHRNMEARLSGRLFMRIRKLLIKWDSIFGIWKLGDLMHNLLVISELAAAAAYRGIIFESISLKLFASFTTLLILTQFLLAIVFAEKMKAIPVLLGSENMREMENGNLNASQTYWVKNEVCCIRGGVFTITSQSLALFAMTIVTIVFLRSSPQCTSPAF